MKLSRRQFLLRSAFAGAALVAPKTLMAKTRRALPIPPLLDVGRGRPIRLDFRPAQTQFEQGKLVSVWGANGQYLAPTVRVKSGDFVRLTYLNNLPEPLSINIQGLLAPTEMHGSIHRQFAPNSSWSPIVSVHQRAGTAWYHADTMLNAATQVQQGLAGLWIIDDAESRKTDLPNRYGVNDIPLILQDQLINSRGEPVINTQAVPFFGKQLLTNGQPSPYLNVPRGWLRLRLVNASLSRRYELRLDNDQPLYLIGTGMGYFAQPLVRQSVSLAPSERVELLLELNDDAPVSLISGQKRGFFYPVEQFFADNEALIDNVVVEFRPQGLASAFSKPPSLPPFPTDDFNLKIAAERKFNLRPLDRLINQQRFDPKRIDFHAQKGSVERWYLTSNEAVGFSLQGAKFVLETENRQKRPLAELAWRDTVWLEKDQEVTLLVRFEHSASASLPFTFGVTDLPLKDKGAMGQFSVG